MRLMHIRVGGVFLGHLWHFDKRRSLLFCVCLFSCCLISCEQIGTETEQKGVQQVALAQLHWCGKPFQLFRDEGALAPASSARALPGASPMPGRTPVTLKDWAQAEQSLNFRLYLPRTLPTGTCLISAYGTVHDAIFGSSFTIAYLLPDHSSLSLSEAPLRSQRPDLQCSSVTSAEPGSAPQASQSVQLCSGARKTTSIVFSAQWSSELLHTFFQELQEKNEWLPMAESASGNTLDAQTVL